MVPLLHVSIKNPKQKPTTTTTTKSRQQEFYFEKKEFFDLNCQPYGVTKYRPKLSWTLSVQCFCGTTLWHLFFYFFFNQDNKVVESLDLEDNWIGADGASSIAQILTSNHVLTEIVSRVICLSCWNCLLTNPVMLNIWCCLVTSQLFINLIIS